MPQLLALGNAATNAHGRTKVDLELMLSRLRIGSERIAVLFRLRRAVLLAARSVLVGDVPFGRFWFGWRS